MSLSSPAASAGNGQGQENITSQLLASAQAFEAQLVTLRAEHELLRVEARALRRCLDRRGLLPADELEREVESCKAGSGREAVSPPLESACAAILPEDAADSAVSRRQSSRDSPPRATSPRASAHAVTGRRLSSPLSGLRGRSPGKSPERVESDGRPKSRPRSRSQTGKVQQDEGEGGGEGGPPEGDLYELMSKLLDQSTSVGEQQRAVRSVQQLLKRNTEAPNTWHGPGTPLSAVVRAGRSDLARLLLRARANVNERDAKGVTALHVATYDGNTELCRVLLVGRADVDACDRHGQTPLFFAPNREICKLLIERRSDVTVLNRKGQSALHLAGRAGLHEVLAWLSSRVSKSLVELRDVHGATARAYAMQSGVPKQDPSSPQAARPTATASSKQRAPSPKVSSRAASPQRAADVPLPLRGGGSSSHGHSHSHSHSHNHVHSQSRQEGAPRRVSSGLGLGLGQPPLSELAEQRAVSVSTPPSAHATASLGEAAPQSVVQHAAAVLEAAAAVATAAVATAAELEATQQTSEAGAFDHEADTWPVQPVAEDSPIGEEQEQAEITAALSHPRGGAQVARGPGAAAPGVLELSEIGVIDEAGEDLAELGIMDDDAPPQDLSRASPQMPAAEAVQDPSVDDKAAVLEGVAEEDVDEPPEVQPSGAADKPLMRLEDELDEVF